MAYGSAAQSTLAKLNVDQAKALRVCCGALRMSPIPGLLVEVGEAPLRLWRPKLVLNYLFIYLFIKCGGSGTWSPNNVGTVGGTLGAREEQGGDMELC